MAFRDISPCAPAHILLVPKARGRLDQLQHATAADAPLLGHLMATVGVIARQEGLTAGFRVVVNDGELGCQSVDHLHLHIIGGTQREWGGARVPAPVAPSRIRDSTPATAAHTHPALPPSQLRAVAWPPTGLAFGAKH